MSLLDVGSEPGGDGGSNPYVGPRSIRPNEPIYGRDHEIEELRDVLVAERLVLLYSPSGAGKTSLIEAGLRPELERRNFRVPPTIRVGHDIAAAIAENLNGNRYLVSALLSLEEARPAHSQIHPSKLVNIRLDDYLDRMEEELENENGDTPDPCLVFDQFEELFTLDPTDQAAKASFLEDVGVALRSRGRWALFSMREDFIAQLDPYLPLVPTRFRTRYRLDLLTPEAAKVAARRPAETAGVHFASDAADKLIDDLRRVRVQRGTTARYELGPHVEPVQLQVVCRQLWSSLTP